MVIKMKGHLLGLFTVLIWGTTFISTKILLNDFQPVEILFFRFVMGFVALFIAYPRRMKRTNWKQEICFAGAGLAGVTLYYLFENIALTYTMASNVSVIMSTSPFFTAIISCIIAKGKEKLKVPFVIGFLIAMTGVYMVSFGGDSMHINLNGDFLAIGAAITWACYSLIVKKIGEFGYNILLVTRKIFAYGLLFIIPALFFFDFKLNLSRFTNPVYAFNIIYLGLGASALCFVTWNTAVKLLGPVKTSIYIYLNPATTVVASMLILKERLTPIAWCGVLFTMLGLVISEFDKIKGTTKS